MYPACFSTCTKTLLLVLFSVPSMAMPVGAAQGKSRQSATPLWIWSQEHEPGEVPIGECYFRKVIHLQGRHTGYIEVAADDQYRVYVNGRLIGEGASWKAMKRFDLGRPLRPGRNVVAIRVDNRNGTTAGLAARIVIQSEKQQERVYLTNPTWRANSSALPLWNTITYADSRWKGARSLGEYGKGPPGGIQQSDRDAEGLADQDKTATAEATKQVVSTGQHPQFKLPEGFEVEHVVGHEETGSLIALCFNEFGQILASQEGGPLLLLFDENNNGVIDSVRTCCERVRNCQGILPVSGRVYVIAEGPEGLALYRLQDGDRDGELETVETVVKFEGSIGEHGPHGMTLGPDGMIYVSLGNHTKFAEPVALTSPHHDYYEGDVTPKYEDPKGHASGVKAPGGGVLRVDLEGIRKELFAGGIRNAYDLAFNGSGDLFVHDSDMESDGGAPWHRPTRLLHVIPGAEFGWRSGWSKWPDYFVDSLPAVLNTGRGSPTGMVYYDHPAYPEEYRDRLFSCDWVKGQILMLKMVPDGATYRTKREVFLAGRPLNVTDIDVGPDGWLYFCTGGRGTKGNVYRVISKRKDIPKVPAKLATVQQAVECPQLTSAWSRQRVSVLRRDLGAKWDAQLRALTNDRSQPASVRVQAILLMHLVGPPPSDRDLVGWSAEESVEMRKLCCFLMGLIGNELTEARLIGLLADEDRHVRRHACEALARSARQVGWDKLVPMLTSSDRFEAWAARRLLERNQSPGWQQALLGAKHPNVFIQGALASVIAFPSPEQSTAIVKRAQELMRGFLPAKEEVALLRLVQVAMLRGKLQPEDVPELAQTLQKRFPQDDRLVNRELVRLLVGLQHGPAIPAIMKYLSTDIPNEDKIHVATHVQFMGEGWPPAAKFALLRFFEQAKVMNKGPNLQGYLNKIANEVTSHLTLDERMYVIQQGHLMPEAALSAMFTLPEDVDKQMRPKLVQLDKNLIPYKGIAYDRLRIGIVAMLARGGDPEAMGYLREIHDRDPDRRPSVAMGLAQSPEGRNWDYLVRSIPLLDGEPAREVLSQLRKVEFAPESPEYVRQVILCGLRLKQNGGMLAARLLEHWHGTKPIDAGGHWESALAAWQRWFDEEHPGEPVADLPSEDGGNTWTYDDLVAYLSSPEAEKGSVERGATVFENAQCAACHIHGKRGVHLGPDLTTVARRFQAREVLESIIYPSQVISDQYASKTVVTSDGKSITGMILVQDEKQVVLADSDGKEIKIAMEEVEEILPSKSSVMPEGLLNNLSLEEIGDLFAFLMELQEPRMVEFLEDIEVR